MKSRVETASKKQTITEADSENYLGASKRNFLKNA